ncbi:MAG: rod shape-determining protein RodA [Synechococcaceae cyanobacterium SM2_3_1]|nr:rod shape-determining protein RodA [Synechococcaceae cyanobacterium SM2_3_1]
MALSQKSPPLYSAAAATRKRGLQQWLGAWKSFDGILLLTVLFLTGIGVLAIHSTRSESQYWIQQLVMGGASIAPCLILARWNYERLLGWHWFLYGLNLLTLIAVLFVGVSGGGAERWISVGGIPVQPSEFAKLAVIITLAAVLHYWPIRYFSQIWLPVMVIAPPWVLIFLQPNLGTAMVFVVILLTMLYWAGAQISWILLLLSPFVGGILYGLHTQPGLYGMIWLWLIWTAAMGLLAAWQLPWRRVGALTFAVLNLLSGQLGQIAWQMLKPYQQLRLLIFTDPSKDPLGSGYHLIQSKIAIGAGGLWGRGFLQGTQTQLDFIPEQHTDFVFSAVAEEVGFIGTITVLVLLWLMCFRLLLIAQHAKDNFGSLIAIGIFAMILFQAVINVGMTVGLAPITGLPLPFLSYGRSALLTNFLAVGVAESVAMHRHRTTFFK